MQKRILVIGGSGLVGEAVARRLLKDGYNVRLMGRNNGNAQHSNTFKIVKGDVTSSLSLKKALVGCSGVHISITEDVEQIAAENIASIAPDFYINRITYTSGTNVCEENSWLPLIRGKMLAEKAIHHSGVPYTVFRPTYFMENLQRFVQRGKAYVFGKKPVLFHLVALEDYARMVSKSYELEETANKTLTIHGPEAYTTSEALERFCLEHHPEISKISPMPLWVVKVMATIRRNKRMKSAGELGSLFEKVGELGDPTEANNILGAPTITLEEWIHIIKG